jgi:hypothetical protein
MWHADNRLAEIARLKADGIQHGTICCTCITFRDDAGTPIEGHLILPGFRFEQFLTPFQQGRNMVGSLLMRRNRAEADTPHLADAQGRAESDWAHNDAGVRGCSSAENPAAYINRNPSNTD